MSELRPKFCGECSRYVRGEGYGIHGGECHAHAPLYTKHSAKGMFPHVRFDTPSCGDAVPAGDIRETRLTRSLKRCPICGADPVYGRFSNHPSYEWQPQDSGDGLYMWCPECNTIAVGNSTEEMIRAWNSGNVKNYDYDDPLEAV